MAATDHRRFRNADMAHRLQPGQARRSFLVPRAISKDGVEQNQLAEIKTYTQSRGWQYYERGGRKDDPAAILSDIQSVFEDGMPADPAAWTDWLDAIETVLKKTPR